LDVEKIISVKHHNTFKELTPYYAMNETNRLKIAVISGAAHALQYKQDNPRASDEDVLRHVTKEMREILKKIGTED